MGWDDMPLFDKVAVTIVGAIGLAFILMACAGG